jgi:hypothetical protein
VTLSVATPTNTPSPVSVFDTYRDIAWPFRFEGTLRVSTIAGGIPSDEKVAEAWLRTKLTDKEDLLREAVAKTMAERGISVEEATEVVASLKHFTGFKRHPDLGLYVEGRQLKAAIKEAAMIAVSTEKIPLKGWGITKKYLKGFVAEHIMVVDDILPLGVKDPSGVVQQFVHTQYGSAPHYKEYVTDCDINFTVITDYDFKPEHWAQIWLTGEQQGIGASRSAGFGRYVVTRWEPVSAAPKRRSSKAAK